MKNALSFVSPDQPQEGYYLVDKDWDAVYLITKVYYTERNETEWEPIPEGETSESLKEKGFEVNGKGDRYEITRKKQMLTLDYQKIDIFTRKPIYNPSSNLWESLKRFCIIERNPFEVVDYLRPMLDKGELLQTEEFKEKIEPPEPSHPSELLEGATFETDESYDKPSETKDVKLCEEHADKNIYRLAESGQKSQMMRELEDTQTHINAMMKMQNYSKFLVEIAKHEMNLKMGGIKNELQRVMAYSKQLNEILYTMQLFLGDLETVELICDGDPAPDSEKVFVYQGVSYTDEDYAYYNQDFDWRNIPEFLEFLKKEKGFWKGLMPHPKSILGCKPKRENKTYSDDPWYNACMNANNHVAFFLIRNGERLYKLDVAITLSDRIIAAKGELQRAYDSKSSGTFKELKKYYTNISALIRGLLYRSEVLSPHSCIMPEVPKIVLADPNLIPVYDLTDALFEGKPSFSEWHDEHAKDIKRGSKVLIDGVIHQIEAENVTIMEYHDSRSRYKEPVHYDFKYFVEERWHERRVGQGCNRRYLGLYDYHKIDENVIKDLEWYARSRVLRSTAVNSCKAVHACIWAWKKIQNERANFGRFVKDFLTAQGYELKNPFQWDFLIDQELKNLNKLLVWKRTMLDHSDTNFRIVCRKCVAKRNAQCFSKLGKLPF